MVSFPKARSRASLAAALLAGGILAIPHMGSAANLETVAVKSRTAQAPTHDVESRIKTLHQELHITPEQETAWKDVAQAMRENATTMEELRSQQAKSEQTATAPDMINAYGKTTDAHADAIKKFAAAFDTLYDGMSADQKKTADKVFQRRVKDAATRQLRSKS